jgi:uncharacterized protein (TIGR03083 family)
VTAADAVLPADLRSRVLDAARRARTAGVTVPAVPVISPVDAFGRAAGALYRTLRGLDAADWRRPTLRDLDVQGLVGHLTGVEEDVQRCLAGDPAVAEAEHVASTQAAAIRQAHQRPAQTIAEWRRAVSRTLSLLAVQVHDDLGAWVALHGITLPLHALLVVRAFELWTHENDIRVVSSLPLSAPDPSTLQLMTTLVAALLPTVASRAGLPGPARLHLVLTGPGGGTWDLEIDGDTRPEPATMSIVTDAVGFCRLAADRVTPAQLAVSTSGDRDQAAGVLAAAALLALD